MFAELSGNAVVYRAACECPARVEAHLVVVGLDELQDVRHHTTVLQLLI